MWFGYWPTFAALHSSLWSRSRSLLRCTTDPDFFLAEGTKSLIIVIFGWFCSFFFAEGTKPFREIYAGHCHQCHLVICDTSSVTCAHLWHGSLNMWQFYTVIHWRVIFTKDNHQHSSYVPCQPGHLSPAENFERLDQSMQVIRCTSWQSIQVIRIVWTSLQPPRCASRQANKLTSSKPKI